MINKEIEMQKIKEFMSRDVQLISPDETIREAAQHMLKGNFGMMPIGENDRMIGSISDRDIAIRAVAAGMDALGDFAVERADIAIAGEALAEISQPA